MATKMRLIDGQDLVLVEEASQVATTLNHDGAAHRGLVRLQRFEREPGEKFSPEDFIYVNAANVLWLVET